MRKLLYFIAFSMLPFITTAQEQKFHFGLKITPSMAWIKPDNKGTDRDGYRVGFSYGVQTEFRFQDNYAIASGVQVAYRGGNLKSNVLDSTGANVGHITNKFKLQYVEIPICLKMKTNEFGKYRYYGQFGFSPSFRIKAKYDSPVEEDLDAKKAVALFNMNMIIGAGVEYTISGSTVLFGGIEFNNGFFDIFEANSSKGVTNCLGLTIGVLF